MRFPSEAEPVDDGWHVEANGPVGALDLDEDPPTPVAAPVRAALVR